MSEPWVLIVDDDEQICKLLEELFSSWNMTAKSITSPHLVTNEIQANFYSIIFLDVFMPEMSGMDLLARIGELSPDTKVIIMTGYANKELAIKALRKGAFDFLEKPVPLDLLNHVVKRALSVQQIELEHKKTMAELRLRNRELLETNEALAVLTRNVARTGHNAEKRIILQVRSLIFPILEDLRRDENLKIYESQLAILTNYIEDMTSGLSTSLQIETTLSFRELRIALMIKSGMINEEIATHLHISPETVKTHRRNIRKKLGIMGTKRKLSAYLQSLEDNAAAGERSGDM